MKPLAPNTMIQNRYLVVHLIGKGGMGEVYLAVDQRLGSAVALKRTSFAEDQTLAAAFEREAKILARLRHPVLPKVSDHFAENGEQYLVMEHISGDDLSKRLETAGKPFPVSWVMFWADQLLDALSYLHSHEPPIIHRDIKPQNLKLTDDNHIVLLDFGLSKDTSFSSAISSPGTSGSVVGYTPHFAPMEQIRGTGTNPRSDIYSLSATLYQLMTDTVPVDALSRADAMLSSESDPIRALSDINPEISPAVSNVILKGLEVSQEKRFSNAGEMQKSLRAAYAQMQGQMSADTVAFNIGDHAGADLHSTTPPIDPGRSVAPSEMATITPSVPFVTPPQKTTPEPVVHAAAVEEVPSMEATIQMDTPIHLDAPVEDQGIRVVGVQHVRRHGGDREDEDGRRDAQRPSITEEDQAGQEHHERDQVALSEKIERPRRPDAQRHRHDDDPEQRRDEPERQRALPDLLPRIRRNGQRQHRDEHQHHDHRPLRNLEGGEDLGESHHGVAEVDPDERRERQLAAPGGRQGEAGQAAPGRRRRRGGGANRAEEILGGRLGRKGLAHGASGRDARRLITTWSLPAAVRGISGTRSMSRTSEGATAASSRRIQASSSALQAGATRRNWRISSRLPRW